jgi:N-acetylmuramoyl-L-alanine amidase
MVTGCSSVQVQDTNTDTDTTDASQALNQESISDKVQPPDQTSDTTAADASANTAAPVEQINLGTVCIDPGHGNTIDSTQTPIGPGASETQAVEPGGTSGVATGTPEYERNFEIALKLKTQLETRGVTVIMTRTSNDVVMSSQQRAEIANTNKAALFVRLHCDGATNSSRVGFSTLVPGYNEWTSGIAAESTRAASIIHPVVIAGTQATDDGIIQRENLAGFNYSQVPSILFEMGFMTNPDEDELLATESYQNSLASSMADGIVQYLQIA